MGREETQRADRIRQKGDSLGGFEYDGDARDAGAAPGESVYCPGPMRLVIQPDEMAYDMSFVDESYDHDPVTVDGIAMNAENYREYLRDQIDRDGVWTLVGQYWDGESWQSADSICGLIGDEWRAYGPDIMYSTIQAYESQGHCTECGRPRLA